MNSGGDNNFGQNPSGANPWASSTPNNPMQSNPAATPAQPIQPAQPNLGPAPFAGPSSANLSQSVSGAPMMMGGGFNAPAGPIVSSGAGTTPAAPITPRPSGMPARRQFRGTKAAPAAPVATPTAMRSDTPDFFSQAYTDNVMQANANAYDQAAKKDKIKKFGIIGGICAVALILVVALLAFLPGMAPKREEEIYDLAHAKVDEIAFFEEAIQASYDELVNFADVYNITAQDSEETIASINTTLAEIDELEKKVGSLKLSGDSVRNGVDVNTVIDDLLSTIKAKKEFYKKYGAFAVSLYEIVKTQDYNAAAQSLSNMDNDILKRYGVTMDHFAKYFYEYAKTSEAQRACSDVESMSCAFASGIITEEEYEFLGSPQVFKDLVEQMVGENQIADTSQTISRKLHNLKDAVYNREYDEGLQQLEEELKSGNKKGEE